MEQLRATRRDAASVLIIKCSPRPWLVPALKNPHPNAIRWADLRQTARLLEPQRRLPSAITSR